MTSPRRRRAFLAAVVLAALTLAVFWPATGNDFVNYDDRQYVTENPQVNRGLTREGAGWAFTSVGYAYNWHPLTWLSHMLDVELFGLRPAGHHLVNILFHAANAALLLVVLHRMTGAMLPSAFVAALFALHPLHVESVAWVAERKDVLATFFWMAAMVAYAAYAVRPGARRYLAVAALHALGLMAKPMVLTLPLVLPILDWWPLGRWRRGASGVPARPAVFRFLAEKVPLAALSAVSACLTFLAQSRGGSIRSWEAVPLATRADNALLSCWRYLAKAVWPADLIFLYPLPTAPVAAAALLAGALLAAVTAVFWLARRRCPYLLAGWLWYLVTLAPVLGLVQVGSQSMADRYTYIPLTGIFMGLAWGGMSLAGGRRSGRAVLAAFAAVVVVAVVPATRRQLAYWHDSRTLFTRALSVNPDNPIAHDSLGVVLSREGKLDEGVTHYRQAIRLAPYYTTAHYNLGLALTEQGDLEGAVASFRRSIALRPDHPEAHLNLGTALARSGRLAEALAHYREALRLRPGYGAALHNIEEIERHAAGEGR